jgi:hypothetical protein
LLLSLSQMDHRRQQENNNHILIQFFNSKHEQIDSFFLLKKMFNIKTYGFLYLSQVMPFH